MSGLGEQAALFADLAFVRTKAVEQASDLRSAGFNAIVATVWDSAGF